VDVTTLDDPESPAIPSRPLTPTEHQLAGIWRDLLGAAVVHHQDDWFQTGGHSLLTLRLFARIHRDFRRSLPLSTILHHTCLADLALVIDQTPVDPVASPS
jgi:hypothetical protein